MMIFHIIQQSLIFLPFSLGVFLSYRALNKPDLTVDGSFVLGAAFYGLIRLSGGSVCIGLLCAMLMGFFAGAGVALLQYRDRMAPLISGILALFMLQSINLAVMGRPNLNLLVRSNFLKILTPVTGSELSITLILSVIVITAFTALVVLMRSRTGLLIRAFGDNATLLSLTGHLPEQIRFIGLGLSNSLVALSGALTAQYQGYVDIGMGTGNVLIGIGTVIIGQQIVEYLAVGRSVGILLQIASCLLGVILYFTLVNSLVAIGVNPIYLKLAIGAVIAALLFFNQSHNNHSLRAVR